MSVGDAVVRFVSTVGVVTGPQGRTLDLEPDSATITVDATAT